MSTATPVDPPADGLVTSQMREWIGQEAWPAQTVVVHEADILRYQEAVGDDIVRRDVRGRLLAPPMYLPPFAVGGDIGEDGRRARPGERVVAPDGLHRRLMGGCDIHFTEAIAAGETITATTIFADIFAKQGRNGPMIMVLTDTTYTDEHGNHKRTERWTIIHR